MDLQRNQEKQQLNQNQKSKKKQKQQQLGNFSFEAFCENCQKWMKTEVQLKMKENQASLCFGLFGFCSNLLLCFSCCYSWEHRCSLCHKIVGYGNELEDQKTDYFCNKCEEIHSGKKCPYGNLSDYGSMKIN